MKVMAHRGYSGVYPENTMLSFREAVKVGCDAIEMDVHETRDGRLVVIHDERLDRTTDGSGRVCDHSPIELLTDENVRDCKEHGVKMNVWTVNDMAGLEQLHRWGCEGIITNFPGVASGWLRAQGE